MQILAEISTFRSLIYKELNLDNLGQIPFFSVLSLWHTYAHSYQKRGSKQTYQLLKIVTFGWKQPLGFWVIGLWIFLAWNKRCIVFVYESHRKNCRNVLRRSYYTELYIITLRKKVQKFYNTFTSLKWKPCCLDALTPHLCTLIEILRIRIKHSKYLQSFN